MPALPPGFRELRRGSFQLIVRDDRAEAAEALGLPESLPELFARAAAQPDGAAGRAPVARIEVPGRDEQWIFRRFVHGGTLGPLLGRAYLGLGRAIRELDVTEELARAGAPVPTAVLAIGERLLGPLVAPTLATVFEAGTRDGLAYLEAPAPERERIAVARAAGRAVRAFHDAGGRHGDLHVKNLLVRDPGGDPTITVIDLDGARVTPGLTPSERMAQVMRLFRSLVKRDLLGALGRRGVAAFFGAYCADDRALRRALQRRVPYELRKVAVHALRYPPRPHSA